MLDDALKTEIQAGYSAFLKARGLKPRRGQKQMIGTIASTLGSLTLDEDGKREGDAAIAVVEAGTGTGKTLAYLLAALPVARAMGKTVVVATGTVSLQSQLLDKDIPELLDATGWRYSAALAKGRGRYLCNIKLDQAADAAGARDSGLYLFEDEVPFDTSRDGAALIEAMARSLDAGDWDGDRDAWPDAIPERQWRALTVDRRQCAGHRCRKVAECCFFRAREALEEADCIVANHDLVMADLALGGGAILPPPDETIYIFDEAHRLADTTLRHFAASAHLQGTVQWLESVEKAINGARQALAGDDGLASGLESAEKDLASALRAQRQAVPLFRAQLDDRLAPGSDHYRYPNGDVGADTRELCAGLAAAFTRLGNRLDDLSSDLEKALDNPHHPVPRVDLEQLFQGVGNWLGRVQSVAELWRLMAAPDPEGAPPLARWLRPDDSGGDITLSVSPISAAELLREKLWYHCFAAVATSATLRALGRFDRFAASTGLPRHAVTTAVPGAFDYADAGEIHIPDIGADGSEPSAHTEALVEHLERLIDPRQGSLVLFSSRRQMEQVAQGAARDFRDLVLMQGDYSHAEIVRRHKQRLDDDRGSVIFGLASFAEGLDLPGRYCGHVLIAKLPFAVPDDPLQSAQAEWLESRGLNPFKTMTLPDASLRLIQACGRLLRTESDRGRITILDRRVLTKFYGRQLLDALPPFPRRTD